MNDIRETIDENAKEILKQIAERIDEIIGRWPESHACARIYKIHQGFEWSEFYQSDTDRTYHLTPEQSRVMDERSKNCWEAFCDENKIDPEISYDDLTQEQSNDYADYENEWFEPALLRLSIQQDDIFLSINYTDQPYYRYQYDEPIFKIELRENIDETIKAMKAAYDDFLKDEKDE